MLTCRITIKIKDYFPQIDSIPYSNYICVFACGDYQGQIPFLPHESKYIQHQIKNISSDIKYKILVYDYNDTSLIGMCEMSISYKVLKRIIPQHGFIQEQQKKLLIDTKTKRKLFGTVVNSGDIYLTIYAEVFLLSKNINEQKQKIPKLKKNNPVIDTPKCYIKYNFALNKGDFSPKSSKNNKSTMINTGSGKQTLNISKQDKENFTSKNVSNNSINFRKDVEKKSLGNFSNYNIINNNINFFNKKSEDDIYNNRKNIMELFHQKNMMEEMVEKYNKSDLDDKIEFEEKVINNNLYINNINNKEDNITEENFNQKFVNYNNNFKQQKNLFKLNTNINSNINTNYNIDEDEETEKLFYYSKNTLSPNEIKHTFSEEEKRNMSKTYKNRNVIDPNMNIINQNYVYSSKNKMIKMGKIYTKAKINDNSKKNINIVNNNNIKNRKSNDFISINYLTNNNSNYYNNENTQFENINNTYLNNNINNYNQNIINPPSSKYSDEEKEEEGEDEDDYLDIDRIILDKGAELRNNFQIQIKQYSGRYKNHRTINNLNNNSNNFDQNQNYDYYPNFLNYNSRTPYNEKTSKYANSQGLNNNLTQEDVKNNCIRLIEFYSLLNIKLKKIFPKNEENTQKLIIFKELLSHESKKRNLISNKINKNKFIYNLSTNINEATNEKILSYFPKIKKIENSIYQQLFNVFNTEEELAKFNEFENYDKQTKIFLLLNLARNLVKKYGNISQVYTIKNSVNIKKKKKLKKCLQNYLITEKDAGDKDYINLENINREIQNRNEINDDSNKFKVIKEVDEDKEEENDAEEDIGIREWKDNSEIKGLGYENRDQIIDDADLIEENNDISKNNNFNINDKSRNDEHLKENISFDNYINIEDNANQSDSNNNIEHNDNIREEINNKDIKNEIKENEGNKNNKENNGIESYKEQNNNEKNITNVDIENGQKIENIE